MSRRPALDLTRNRAADPGPALLPVLLPAEDRRYAVTFLLPQGWRVLQPYEVEADGQREAIGLACRRRWWAGSPINGATGGRLPQVQPIAAEVWYRPTNPAGDKGGPASCMRWTATHSYGSAGREFVRPALFVPVRDDLADHELDDPENWRQR